MEYMDEGGVVNERLLNDARAQVIAQGMAGSGGQGATGTTAYVV